MKQLIAVALLRFPILFLVCAALRCVAGDVMVVLKDGSVVEGELQSEEEDSIIVKTATGRQTIATAKIKEWRKKQAAVTASDPGSLKPDAAELLQKAEAAVGREELKEASKYYLEAIRIDDSIVLHRRMAHAFFEAGERIKNRFFPEFEASLARWEKARQDAYEDRRSLHEGMKHYKKFNPENPAYKAATEKHKEILKKISQCFPYFTKAQESFGAVLRLAPFGKDFDAAGYLALCLTVREDELNTRVRGRQLLVAFLETYKPANDSERQLYQRCRSELDRINKEQERP